MVVFKLTEDQAKATLKAAGLPVPEGFVCVSAAEAAAAAERLGGGAVVKALIPTGRRGKAGAVKLVATPAAAASAAASLIGTEALGHRIERVYVEARFPIARELYLSFLLEGMPPKVVLSTAGGVDIEETHRDRPGAIIQGDVDPLTGFTADQARTLWGRAGVTGPEIAGLAEVSAALWRAFRATDAVLMEINPLALDASGRPSVVGAMIAIDENGLPRHPEWAEQADGSLIAAWRGFNEREKRIAEVNRQFKGGAIRYTELDGDIGLFVGGGGAGLLQHDMILAEGGRPANHTDMNPGDGTGEKNKAVYLAVLDNPNTNCLLIGFNYLQLAQCEQKVKPLLAALKERGVDPRDFPIVLRVLGPGEEAARAMVKDVPGITYLAPDSSLDDGVRLICEINRAIVQRKQPAAR
ncbi:MAG: hypothetical protein EXQ96_05645 [Alphaproteobacteria bacterium]|nr:hypothetical protein [Alphaproteobacteria bacterium]